MLGRVVDAEHRRPVVHRSRGPLLVGGRGDLRSPRLVGHARRVRQASRVGDVGRFGRVGRRSRGHRLRRHRHRIQPPQRRGRQVGGRGPSPSRAPDPRGVGQDPQVRTDAAGQVLEQGRLVHGVVDRLGLVAIRGGTRGPGLGGRHGVARQLHQTELGQPAGREVHLGAVDRRAQAVAKVPEARAVPGGREDAHLEQGERRPTTRGAVPHEHAVVLQSQHTRRQRQDLVGLLQGSAPCGPGRCTDTPDDGIHLVRIDVAQVGVVERGEGEALGVDHQQAPRRPRGRRRLLPVALRRSHVRRPPLVRVERYHRDPEAPPRAARRRTWFSPSRCRRTPARGSLAPAAAARRTPPR